MFKSLFAKYMAAFMAIIVVSFCLLAVITSTLINEYAIDSQKNRLSQAAQAVSSYITNSYSHVVDGEIDVYFAQYSRTIKPFINATIRNIENVAVVITDTDGKVLYHTENQRGLDLSGSMVSSKYIGKMTAGQEIYIDGTLDDFFEQRYYLYGVPVYRGDGQLVATAMVGSSDGSIENLLDAMVKTIFLSTIFIALASLIAVYFISERIIAPLKNMRNAAKKFADGEFDVRVPVVGNDEVAELAGSFNNMAAALETLETMRNTFLANVSHDLRTPMTTISGFIDGILDGAIPKEKHEYYLGIIRSEVRRLSRLVSTLLDISRIQAGERKFEMKPFDICEMARQILISFEQKIDAKHLDVAFDCDDEKMSVLADPDAIYQILYNICDNGVKFAKEGGRYEIAIRRKDKKIHVSVYNEGQGIAEEDQPYIFDQFYKSDKSRGLDKTGVGLGMFIAKTIISAHKEQIWVESTAGEFCRFTFTLQPND